VADLWVSPYGFTIDYGKHGQFNPCDVCSGSQDTAWVKMKKILSVFPDFSESSIIPREVKNGR
jgi:hypothetical protein